MVKMNTEEKTNEYKFEKIQEPEDFHAISNNDDLFLTSKEVIELLLNELESVEHNEELAKFYSQFSNNIDDRTVEVK